MVTIRRAIGDPWSALGNPKNYWWNKSLAQNLKEIGYMGQVTGLVIPSALAYKSLAVKTASFGTVASSQALKTSTSVVGGAGAGAGGLAGAGLAGAGSLIPLAGAGLKLAWYTYLLTWLEKNWFIPVGLGGLYVVSKFIGRK